jgi:hypothetical protein
MNVIEKFIELNNNIIIIITGMKYTKIKKISKKLS